MRCRSSFSRRRTTTLDLRRATILAADHGSHLRVATQRPGENHCRRRWPSIHPEVLRCFPLLNVVSDRTRVGQAIWGERRVTPEDPLQVILGLAHECDPDATRTQVDRVEQIEELRAGAPAMVG